jgi:ABC-2 type transport system ATP-binding protein
MEWSQNLNDHAIQTESLRKEFNGKAAVRDLTLTVQRGEVFGFLGPNGAGKTTSIKMLLGLVKPTSGSATVLGVPISKVQARKKVGFLPEHFRFHDWLTAGEFLRLHADLYGIPAARSRQRIVELLERVGLAEHAGQKLRTFSKGMLQRVGLAQALLDDPALVFLDEPTSGLDPVGRRMVRDIIRDLRQRGTAVFLNSHLLSEVEITCDRVAFVKHGEVLRVDVLNALVEGEVSVGIRATGWTPAMVAGLARWGQNVRLDGETCSLTLAGEADLPEVNRYLVAQGLAVYALTPQRVSLEDLFIQIVGTDGGL